VGGDDLLRRYLEGDHPKVHLGQAVDPEGKDEEEAGPPEIDQPAEPEHDPSLVFLGDPDRGSGQHHDHQRYDADDDDERVHRTVSFWHGTGGVTESSSPLLDDRGGVATLADLQYALVFCGVGELAQTSKSVVDEL